MTAPRAHTGEVDLAAGALPVHDHVLATGRGPAAFADTVAAVLDHTHPSELVMVAGRVDSSSPTGARVLREGFDRGCLMLLDPADAYRPLDDELPAAAAAATRAAFDRLVAGVLAEGYRAVRVVADTTDRLAGADADAAERWWRWEHVADVWETQRPVTGVCWVDADRVAPADLRAAARRHARSAGTTTSWRVFRRPVEGRPGETRLAVAGDVEAFDAAEFAAVLHGARAVDDPEAGPDVSVDLRDVGYLHHRAVHALAGLAGPGGGVDLVDAPAGVRRVLAAVDWWAHLR